VAVIDSLGKSFDIFYHYAISTVEKNDYKDGQIVDEIKKGYMIGNKILRPSQVVVVKNIIKKEGA
jgi:molecular chaperone GrpE